MPFAPSIRFGGASFAGPTYATKSLEKFVYYTPTEANIPDITYSDSFRLEVEVALGSDITTEQWIYSDFASAQQSIAVRVRGGNFECYTVGTGGQNIFTIPAVANTVSGLVIEFGLASTSFGANGAVVTKTSKGSFVPSPEAIFIGQKDGLSNQLQGFVRAIRYLNYENAADNREYDFAGAESVLIDSIGSANGVVTGGVGQKFELDYPTLTNVDTTDEYNVLTPESHVSAYLMIGQSNTVSRATLVAGIDDNYSRVSGGVDQFGVLTKNLKPAANPLEHHDAAVDSAGFWLEMSNRLSGRQLLIPTAKGDTGIISGDWPKGGFYYNAAVDTANRAMASSVNMSIAGVLMIMGEKDADLSNQNYDTGLLTMRSDMIADIGALEDQTKWVVVEISGSSQPQNVPTINAALASFVAAIPDGYIVSNSGLSMFDVYHYDIESQRTIGQRVADYINGTILINK